MMGRRWVVALGVFAFSCALFAPAVRGGFIMIDDPVYVVENPLVRAGLSLDGVRQAFVSPTSDLWLPLSTISHMADVSLFGLAPAGHHLTNVLLHATNAALVFLLLTALTGAPSCSVAVALLFAIHPLRVESVAWVTERKDLLSACFALLSVDAYGRWIRAPTAGRYAATCALYALSLLAKPMVVTLPVLLLLLDVWPLARRDVTWTRRVVEKLPLAVLAGLAAWVTVAVAGHATVSLQTLSLDVRLGNAVVSCVRYLAAMAWPAGLAVYYPYPPPWPTSVVVAAAAVIAGLCAAAVLFRSRAPWIAVGWAWYLVALLPVIGIIQAGMQAMADRFTYLPSLGVLVAVVWSIAALVEARPALRTSAVAAMVLAVLGFGGATRIALDYWRDDHALFTRALAVTERNWFVHANYGDTFFYEGRLDEAAAQYEQALAIEPRTPVAQMRLGTIVRQRGDIDRAIEHFAAALRVRPDLAEAVDHLASTLEARGMPAADAGEAATALGAAIGRSQADVSRPLGRQYNEGVLRVLWQGHTELVVRCRTELGGALPFDLFITVDPGGTVAETGTGPASPLGHCIAAGLVGAQVPAPPFAPFHAWVTMRLA